MTLETRTAEATIDGRRYPIATDEKGQLLWRVVEQGKELAEEWDFRNGTLGMGETARQTHTGYLFTDNIDTTSRGLRLSPTITTISLGAGNWPTGRVGYWFEATKSGARYVYVSVPISATVVRTFKIRASDNTVQTGATRSDTVAGASDIDPGQVAQYQLSSITSDTHIYRPIGLAGAGITSTLVLQRLDIVDASANPGAVDTWAAHDTALGGVNVLLVEDPSEGTARLIRGRGSQFAFASANPLVEANWGSPFDSGGGAAHAVVVGGTSLAGITYLARADNLYTTDPAGNAYPIVKAINIAGNLEALLSGSGRDTFSDGENAFYSHPSGLYMVRGLQDIFKAGPDDIPYYNRVPVGNAIVIPRKFRHFGGVVYGKWYYFIYADSTNLNNSYILACKKGPHPASGLPLIIDTLIQRPNEIRSLFIDSAQRLWWGEPGQNRVAFIQLAADGSPDSTSRGNVSSTYEWYGPEVAKFGSAPTEALLQLRYMGLEAEGGSANASIQMKAYRDSEAVQNVGSAVTTAEFTESTLTAGTSDTFRRYRPRVTITTNGSWAPSTEDLRLLRLKARAYTGDLIETVIKADDASLEAFGITAEDAEDNLRRLVAAQAVTAFEPGTINSFTCHVESVRDAREITPSGAGYALAVRIRRWVTD